MARVLPSDVVRVIDNMFPWAPAPTPPGQSPTALGAQGDVGGVAAIVALVDGIPVELIILPPPEYAAFLAGVAALRSAVQAWQSLGGKFLLAAIPGFTDHPMHLVPRALATCPDEATAVGTTDLLFVTDTALRESIRRDISAATRDLGIDEWKGATVLAGAAVEALLLWAVKQQPSPSVLVAIAALKAPTGPLNRSPDSNPENWDLHEFTEVAAQLRVIEPETAVQVRQARNFRNLIHPGRAARLGQKCDRGTALAALAAVEFVVRDLTP
jgi:hypothetical protein